MKASAAAAAAAVAAAAAAAAFACYACAQSPAAAAAPPADADGADEETPDEAAGPLRRTFTRSCSAPVNPGLYPIVTSQYSSTALYQLS